MEKNKFLDEEYYMQGTPDVIKHYQKIHEDRENVWIIERIMYQDALQKYEEFIIKLAKFIRSLGYKNSLDTSFCLSYLIHCGYLSVDKEFSDKAPDPETEITAKLGINIILGDGCCRNYSSIHHNVFSRLGLPSEYFYCYQGIQLFGKTKAVPANHAINLIEYDGNTYGIDMYNVNNLFHFIDSHNLQEIATERRSILRYKPHYELEMGESTIEDIKRKLERFAECAKKRAINPFDYEADIKYEIKKKIRSQEAEFEDFHQETKSLKKEIKECVATANAGLHK